MGRIVKDKGIKEVVEMFKTLQHRNLKVKLLILGNPEKIIPLVMMIINIY